MSEPLKDLRELSDKEIISRHDHLAESTQVGLDHYLREMYRRDQDRQTQAMLGYTQQIKIMTIVITVLTFINVVVAGWLLVK